MSGEEAIEEAKRERARASVSAETCAPEDAATPFVLALDIGTSSVRAAFYDARAREISGTQARIERPFCMTAEGGAEWDAEELTEEVARVMDAALARAAQGVVSEVAAVVVSCFWHSLVGVGEDGRALTPVLGWADTRAGAAAEELRRLFDERRAHARTGCPFHASYWPAKLLWLERERPATVRAVRRWLSFGEFLALRWSGASNVLEEACGAASASISMASGTGLFDQRACTWDERLLADLRREARLHLDIEQLPGLSASDDATYTLGREYAERWPRLRGRPVFPAIADGAANHIGAGCVAYDAASLMVGTSGAMRVMFDARELFDADELSVEGQLSGEGELSGEGQLAVEGRLAVEGALPGEGASHASNAPRVREASAAMRDAGEATRELPRALWCYRVDRRRALVGGALSDGGGLREWMLRTFLFERHDVDAASIERELAAMQPDAHGLIVLPFWAGERSTGWHDSARGGVLGMTVHTRPLEILRAALEAVAYRFARIADALAAVAPGGESLEIRASGGALRASPAWTQIVADVLGRRVKLLDVNEASSRGAVLLALEASGAIKSIADAPVPSGEVYEPQAAHRARYEDAAARQQKFYELLVEHRSNA